MWNWPQERGLFTEAERSQDIELETVIAVRGGRHTRCLKRLFVFLYPAEERVAVACPGVVAPRSVRVVLDRPYLTSMCTSQPFARAVTLCAHDARGRHGPKMPETRGLGLAITVPAGMTIKRRFKCSCESLPFQDLCCGHPRIFNKRQVDCTWKQLLSEW